MPSNNEIKNALLRGDGLAYGDATGVDRGWNAGVIDVTSGNHDRIEQVPDMYDDPPHYVGGFYFHLEDEDYYGGMAEWYQGWNEGKEAALDMKNGVTSLGKPDKTAEEIAYERRMKCFTMAEKYAPQPAIRGGEREPVGETIKRAEALHDYFYSGTIPGAPVNEGK